MARPQSASAALRAPSVSATRPAGRVPGFPKRFPVLNHRLPIDYQSHDSPKHQRCEHHLLDDETFGLFVKKPTGNPTAHLQQQIGRPGEPITYINARQHTVGTKIFAARRTVPVPPESSIAFRSQDSTSHLSPASVSFNRKLRLRFGITSFSALTFGGDPAHDSQAVRGAAGRPGVGAPSRP
jgi:hypothetical protein